MRAWLVLLMLLLAATVQAEPTLSDCTPMSWPFRDPALLSLLDGSPINCLMVDPALRTPELLGAIRRHGLRVVSVQETTRAAMLTARGPVVATAQGFWPGIRLEADGSTPAGPTSTPWIDTNSGFLRYARAVLPRSTAIWLSNRPPEGLVRVERYLQAISDAALAGCRWVVCLDSRFAAALASGEAPALESWGRIQALLRFYKENMDVLRAPEYSRLAVLEDESGGALLSGNIVDMISSRRTPWMVLTPGQLARGVPDGVRVLRSPVAWNVPRFTEAFAPDQAMMQQVATAWKQIDRELGRSNLGVRVFNATGVLTNLRRGVTPPRLILHLVNYTDYPVESVTVHALGAWRSAFVIEPDGRQSVAVYRTEDGTGVGAFTVRTAAILILE